MSEDEAVAAAQASEPKPVEIERQIEELRGDLEELVDELDRRRHDALDWRLQLRKHARPIAIGACVLAGGVLLTAVLRRRSRVPAPWSERFGQLLAGRPVERPPSRTLQLAKNAAVGATGVAVRFAAQRAIDGMRNRSAPSAEA